MDMNSTRRVHMGNFTAPFAAEFVSLFVSPRLIRLINVVSFTIHDIALVDCE